MLSNQVGGLDMSPQDHRALRRAQRKNIPESQPPVKNTDKSTAQPPKNIDDLTHKQPPYRQQKTKRQRELEREQEEEKSRKLSSTTKKKAMLTIRAMTTKTHSHTETAKMRISTNWRTTINETATNTKKKNKVNKQTYVASSESSSDSDPEDFEAPNPMDSWHGSITSHAPKKWQTYEKRKNKLSATRHDQQFVSDLARMECWLRTAIHDFVTNTLYKQTVMYWPLQSTTAVASQLFKRHKEDLHEFVERYGSERAVLELFGPGLRMCGNYERAVQTTQLRRTFLSKQNPDTRMAENVLEGEIDTMHLDSPPRLHKNLRHLESIEALRDLLVSPKMYQDKILFDLFCTGLESGNFRQTKKRPFKPLDLLITKAHEAHFRVEVYFALSQKCYRHINSPALYAARIALFNQVIKSVREGRDKYLEDATAARNAGLTDDQRTEFELQNEEGNQTENNVDIDEDDM